MSDNLGYTPGAGATIATRDIGGGLQAQRVILSWFDGTVWQDTSSTMQMPVELPIDQDGTLQGILYELSSLNSKIPLMNAAAQIRVAIEAATVANLSTNVAQFGGSNVATGTGAGGAGVPRVTVSNDSTLAATIVAGMTQVLALQQSWNNAPVQHLLSSGFAVTGGP